ncbi:hypothetical protein J6590_093815, partial [Homalodisca vitripennis]
MLWDGSSINNLERVLILQKMALRIIGGLEERESCRRIFPEKKILTAVFVYEVVEMGIAKNAKIHGRNTRFAHNYNLLYHRTKLFEKKPSYLGGKFFDALPEEVKNLSDPVNLKTSPKAYAAGEQVGWRRYRLTHINELITGLDDSP